MQTPQKNNQEELSFLCFASKFSFCEKIGFSPASFFPVEDRYGSQAYQEGYGESSDEMPDVVEKTVHNLISFAQHGFRTWFRLQPLLSLDQGAEIYAHMIGEALSEAYGNTLDTMPETNDNTALFLHEVMEQCLTGLDVWQKEIRYFPSYQS